MPSAEQCKELIENCTFTWPKEFLCNGGYFMGKNGGMIFLPAAGVRHDSDIYYRDSNGYYWSGSEYPNNTNVMYSIYFNYGNYVNWYDDNFVRYGGRPVRPVIPGKAQYLPLTLSDNTLSLKVGEEKTVTITSGNGSYTVKSSNTGYATVSLSGNTVKVKGVKTGSATITVTDSKSGQTASISVTVTSSQNGYLSCPDNHHPHMIDLGLPSGTLWACCNVGASKPEDNGGYYAWGETSEKSVYNEVTYLYCTGDDTDGNGLYDKNQNYKDLGSSICGTDYDVAYVKWGGAWKMPSSKQCEELIDNSTYSWTTKNGVRGLQLTGKTKGSIFLPAAGYYWYSKLDGLGSYWSGTYARNNDSYACYFKFDDTEVTAKYAWYRVMGRPVRPVQEKQFEKVDFNIMYIVHLQEKAVTYYGDAEITQRIVEIRDQFLWRKKLSEYIGAVDKVAPMYKGK